MKKKNLSTELDNDFTFKKLYLFFLQHENWLGPVRNGNMFGLWVQYF